MSGGYRWYVLVTKPKAEAEAQVELQAKRFETFLPLERYTVRRDAGKQWLRQRTRALFPCYLFVRFDVTRLWYQLRYARGILDILTDSEGTPTPVRAGDVEQLMAEHNRAGGFYVRRPKIAKGDSVEVPIGRLEGKTGTVKALVNCGGELHVNIVVDERAGRFVVSLPHAVF